MRSLAAVVVILVGLEAAFESRLVAFQANACQTHLVLYLDQSRSMTGGGSVSSWHKSRKVLQQVLRELSTDAGPELLVELVSFAGRVEERPGLLSVEQASAVLTSQSEGSLVPANTDFLELLDDIIRRLNRLDSEGSVPATPSVQRMVFVIASDFVDSIPEAQTAQPSAVKARRDMLSARVFLLSQLVAAVPGIEFVGLVAPTRLDASQQHVLGKLRSGLRELLREIPLGEAESTVPALKQEIYSQLSTDAFAGTPGSYRVSLRSSACPARLDGIELLCEATGSLVAFKGLPKLIQLAAGDSTTAEISEDPRFAQPCPGRCFRTRVILEGQEVPSSWRSSCTSGTSALRSAAWTLTDGWVGPAEMEIFLQLDLRLAVPELLRLKLEGDGLTGAKVLEVHPPGGIPINGIETLRTRVKVPSSWGPPGKVRFELVQAVPGPGADTQGLGAPPLAEAVSDLHEAHGKVGRVLETLGAGLLLLFLSSRFFPDRIPKVLGEHWGAEQVMAGFSSVAGGEVAARGWLERLSPWALLIFAALLVGLVIGCLVRRLTQRTLGSLREIDRNRNDLRPEERQLHDKEYERAFLGGLRAWAWGLCGVIATVVVLWLILPRGEHLLFPGSSSLPAAAVATYRSVPARVFDEGSH